MDEVCKMNDPKRYSIFNPQEQENPNGAWVHYSDYARLKAECQARQAENSVLAVECDSLKAEVERMKEGNECLDQMHEKEMARSAFLCEQVERLTKAGDALLERWISNEGVYYETEEAKDVWNAAKGVQS
jgi:hypothetical protein